MKAHKTESCTGKSLPSFWCVGLYQSRLSLSPSLWVWVGTWGGENSFFPTTIIWETKSYGILTPDWATLLVSEHLKVWGLCKMAPGFSSPNKSIVDQCYFYFIANHSFFISFVLAVATQVNTKWVAKASFSRSQNAHVKDKLKRYPTAIIHQDQFLFCTARTAATIRMPVPAQRKL